MAIKTENIYTLRIDDGVDLTTLYTYDQGRVIGTAVVGCSRKLPNPTSAQIWNLNSR